VTSRGYVLHPYPSFLYELAWDVFSIVRCWSAPTCDGSERGRMFEQLFYRYCTRRGLPLNERSGSRTLNGAHSASGFSHESDAVIATPEINVHIELKHLTVPVAKMDLVSFNQKGLDFIAGENARVRSKPLLRILASATPVETVARVFAVQWGIQIIEPDRLPILAIHSLAKGRLRHHISTAEKKRIISEVPNLIVPLQQRVRQLASFLDSGVPIVGATRINWVLQMQRIIGERCWRALDDVEPSWIEDRYDEALWGVRSGFAWSSGCWPCSVISTASPLF